MSTSQASSTSSKTATPVTSRKKLRKAGRAKRQAKIATDKEFAKTLFAGKSKRSADKKVAFRKRNAKK